MSVKSRLLLAATACCLLSSCGLIGTALRLAPYYFLLADENGQPKSMEMRAREVQGKGSHGIPRSFGSPGAQVAFRP
ncbi:hypothetical protein [Prosthecobacter vanneervenii]|uniref:Lipoprotein n=1 Tax=Prosthecobacter vanneervenii TaxID=48466 RepID=A0A7W7Y8X7_9BACT|nr:hypothetical protein [Prosthecobacter vanneervenii]MBB5031781.1 hypothetical protein [Prosthecobacter vanneervenii]